MKQNTKKAIKSIFLILTPLILVLIIFGKAILGFIGESYVESYGLLLIIVLSSYFVSIFQIFLAIAKVKMHLKNLILIVSMNFILILVLSYIFMFKFGILGLGYAWLLSYILTDLTIIIIMRTNIFDY